MNTYVIRRRSVWATPAELETAASRSARVGAEEMPNQVRWIRSYVVQEADGRLGTLCVYEGQDPAAIREHAERSGLLVEEIVPVVRTVLVRDDPQETGSTTGA